MARRYSTGAQRKVKRVLHEFKKGKLHSGRGRRVVRKRKQAIAIALSQARKAGKKVPPAPKKRRR
jgi:hypothetical protein